MGLLDKLWDDVVAGPRPSEGLGKLRRRIGDPAAMPDDKLTLDQQRRGMSLSSSGKSKPQSGDEKQAATKSIPIRKKKPPTLDLPSDDPSSSPSSPSGMSPLLSPCMASPASREKAVRQSFFRQCNAATTACDLIVISALDK